MSYLLSIGEVPPSASVYKACLENDSDRLRRLATPDIHCDSATGRLIDSLLPVIQGQLRYCSANSSSVPPLGASYEVGVISLKGSHRLWSFSSNYCLERRFHLVPGINPNLSSFSYDQHPITQGVRAVPGQEKSVGCTLSHIYLWFAFKQDPPDYLLVLEDDAVTLPYSNLCLRDLMNQLPHDADFVYVNGRSSERLYLGSRYQGEGLWSGLPTRFLYTRSEMLGMMRAGYHKLRGRAAPELYNGGDGYILTKGGLSKLIAFVEEHGIGSRPLGKQHNIDLILTALTSSISDNNGFPLVPQYDAYKNEGFIRETPFLKAYCCDVPLVETRLRLGLSESARDRTGDTGPLTNSDVYLVRNAAISLEDSRPKLAKQLMQLAGRYKPGGKIIRQKLEHYLGSSQKANSDMGSAH